MAGEKTLLWLDKNEVIQRFYSNFGGLRPSRSKIKTLEIYKTVLGKFFRWLGLEPDEWFNSKRDHAEDIRNFIEAMARENIADSTLRVWRAALSTFAKTLNIEVNLPRVGSNRKVKHDEVFTKEVIKRILDHGDLRERALVLLASTTGLRLAELAGLTVDDVSEFWTREEEPYLVRVRDEIAKGGHGYITFTTQEARDAITAYIERIKRYGRRRWDGKHIFLERTKTLVIFRNAIRKAGLEEEGKWYRIHGLRRYCRTALALAGIAPDVVERLIGHASSSIRQVYTALDLETLRNEYKKALPLLKVYQVDRDSLKRDLIQDLERKIEARVRREFENRLYRLSPEKPIYGHVPSPEMIPMMLEFYREKLATYSRTLEALRKTPDAPLEAVNEISERVADLKRTIRDLEKFQVQKGEKPET
jgi:integrase